MGGDDRGDGWVGGSERWVGGSDGWVGGGDGGFGGACREFGKQIDREGDVRLVYFESADVDLFSEELTPNGLDADFFDSEEGFWEGVTEGVDLFELEAVEGDAVPRGPGGAAELAFEAGPVGDFGTDVGAAFGADEPEVADAVADGNEQQ